jgi:hypothetical protein
MAGQATSGYREHPSARQAITDRQTTRATQNDTLFQPFLNHAETEGAYP